MDENRIQVGDLVQVNINSAQITLAGRAAVVHMPQATGDSWVFRNSDTGELIYCSEGCTVHLLSKGERHG
jgi:hypothetical protein